MEIWQITKTNKIGYMGLSELTEDNYYSYDFFQNIANFESFCFPAIRKLVFSLKQLDRLYLHKQY